MRIVILFLFILQIIIVSCKKDTAEENQTTNNISPSTSKKFSCTLNNTFWETDSTENVFMLDTTFNLRDLVCNGFDSLRILTVSWGGVGTNTIAIPAGIINIPDSGGIYFGQIVNGVVHDDYDGISGQLQFTSYDSIARKVSGTFNAVVVEQNFGDTVVITNGKFKDLQFSVLIVQ